MRHFVMNRTCRNFTYNFISPSKNGSKKRNKKEKEKYIQYSQSKPTFSRYQTAYVVVRRTVADLKFLKTIAN